MLIHLKKNTFTVTSRLPFDQISGYCDLVKLAHKIYLIASKSGMRKSMEA